MYARLIFICLLTITMVSFNTDDFKDDQLCYPRVRKAYADKEESVAKLLDDCGLKMKSLKLYIRAFKSEKELELWGRNTNDERYALIKTYRVCRVSGKLGPKRQQGDLQIPEGYYHINRFNTASNFYLSMGINYPNKSDRILGVKGNLGGDIFIHGACVTIGCLPITDEEIKELYVFCVEAKNSGQESIPVTIFPSKLSDEEMNRLKSRFKDDDDKINLWTDLHLGYKHFNEKKQLPAISFLSNGRHVIE